MSQAVFSHPFLAKPGDLFFQRRRDLHCAEAIELTGLREGKPPVSHVAICIDQNTLIHALDPNGVEYVSIETFLRASIISANASSFTSSSSGEVTPLENGYQTVVFRLKPNGKNSELISRVIKYSCSVLGKPYDHTYGQKEGAFYCSKLVTWAFQKASGGTHYFPLTPMTFKNPKTLEFFDYWRDHFNRLSMEIPEGHLGSHPAKLLDSPFFEQVFDFSSPSKN